MKEPPVAKIIESWADIAACILAATAITREGTEPTGQATIDNLGGGIIRVTVIIDLVPFIPVEEPR